MPLFEENIEIVTDNHGVRSIGCNHCHQIAEMPLTVGDFPFQIMCPTGRATQGEFRTATERQQAINDFFNRAR